MNGMNMMLKNLMITLLASFGLFIASSSAQAVPELMPYQGFLNDGSGQAISGSVSITFNLYEEQLAPSAVWTETVDNVSVSQGAFSVNLGEVTAGLKDYIYTGRAQYIGISINAGPELSPRTKLGTLPYAFLAYNAKKLDGYAVEDFVTDNELQTFSENLQVGLDADDVNGLIDARGYLDTNAINALIDGRNYVNSDEINQRINNAIDQVNTTIGALQTQVNGLQTQVGNLENNVSNLQTNLTNLQNQFNTLQAQGNAAFILGVSDTASNGWFQYNNEQGVRAAGEMCKDSYPNDASAHFCSLSEIQQALSVGSYDNSISGVNTWVYTTVPRDNDGFKSYCQSFLYNSGHAASGTSLTINTAQASVSGGNGIQLSYTSHLACTQERKVLCCR